MVVELRWRLELTKPQFRRNLGMDWVWPRREVAMLAGAEVPNISPEITLLILCMHGSKHVWSRLIWICDVAQLLNSQPHLDWNEVMQEATQTGLLRPLTLGALLAHRVAGAKVPNAILRRFESDSNACSLARHIQGNLLEAPGSTPASAVPYFFRLLDFNDRTRSLMSLTFLQPTMRDKEVVPLPKSLHALYYLIRPFRLIWDRSPR